MLNEEQAYKVFLDTTHVADLERCGQASFDLTYTEKGLLDARPLSASIAKTPEVHKTSEVKNWLLGYLPEERAHRQRYRVHMHMHDDAYLLTPEVYTNFLSHAHDLVGAIRFEKYGRDIEPQAVPVESIDDVIRDLHVPFGRGASDAVTYREAILPGCAPKVALYRDASGKFYNPKGGFPSTHILKLGTGTLRLNVINEAVSLTLARACGFETSDIEVISTQGRYGTIWALLTKRFDRDVSGTVVKRVHAESFCQALGIEPDRKYGVDTRTCAKLLVNDSMRAEFAKRLCFYYLLDATDMHGMNWELMYADDGSVSLSPMFDVWASYPYFQPNVIGRLAMHIGNEDRPFALMKQDVARLGKDIGLDSGYVHDKFAEVTNLVLDNLDGAFSEVASWRDDLEKPVEQLREHIERPIRSASERLLQAL